jgi:hypothetical protein
MKPQSPPRAHSEIEIVRLAWLAIFVSVFSFLFYSRSGDLLLYGDAVAHINIARRVFDSRTPGLLQLGTVWLPLPHLLIMPFIVSKRMWQSGAGGSVPSMAAFVIGVLGILRLARTALSADSEVDVTTADNTAKVGAWASAIIYVANPNLVYMQATAMGESLYLAFFIWAVVHFAEFTRQIQIQIKTNTTTANRSLAKCGWCLAAACLTRYDGWFLAVVLVVGAALVSCRGRASKNKDRSHKSNPLLRIALVRFILIAAAAPVLWLAYNAAVYRNPLEFANGPYSARAIEQKTATVNPAHENLFAASSYFVKAAELNVSSVSWLGRLWLALALLGTLAAVINGRGRIALLLWTPLPFYALSIAYGSVPIFVPAWWPHSHYNVRYGLQLLPAFAVFVPLGVVSITNWAARISQVRVPQIKVFLGRWAEAVTPLIVLLLAAVSYGAIWRSDPICYREAVVNMRGRVELDKQLAEWVERFPENSTLLMYLGEHSGILEQAAISLKRDINEGNHRVWMQPVDPEGLWERALADPAAYADYLVGFEGDPVWKAAQVHHLTALVEIHTTGQPSAVIFQTRTPGQSQGSVR